MFNDMTYCVMTWPKVPCTRHNCFIPCHMAGSHVGYWYVTLNLEGHVFHSSSPLLP